ncbi:hypothetical protein E4U61_007665 [Claviceps capensis]|nr:hypothetical protein E4U61_007665 [Claviceps capensis]
MGRYQGKGKNSLRATGPSFPPSGASDLWPPFYPSGMPFHRLRSALSTRRSWPFVTPSP